MIANLLFLLSIHMFCKNSHIWHSRFGHISNKVFNHLNNKIGLQFSPNFSSSNCFVCPLAKFKRLSFPNSNNLPDYWRMKWSLAFVLCLFAGQKHLDCLHSFFLVCTPSCSLPSPMCSCFPTFIFINFL